MHNEDVDIVVTLRKDLLRRFEDGGGVLELLGSLALKGGWQAGARWLVEASQKRLGGGHTEKRRIEQMEKYP